MEERDSPAPLISLAQARELMGEEARHLSDEQMMELVQFLDQIATPMVRPVPDK